MLLTGGIQALNVWLVSLKLDGVSSYELMTLMPLS